MSSNRIFFERVETQKLGCTTDPVCPLKGFKSAQLLIKMPCRVAQINIASPWSPKFLRWLIVWRAGCWTDLVRVGKVAPLVQIRCPCMRSCKMCVESTHMHEIILPRCYLKAACYLFIYFLHSIALGHEDQIELWHACWISVILFARFWWTSKCWAHEWMLLLSLRNVTSDLAPHVNWCAGSSLLLRLGSSGLPLPNKAGKCIAFLCTYLKDFMASP